MWDILSWHDGTLSIAWWFLLFLALVLIAAGGARAAR
jgi:hypothetical protein